MSDFGESAGANGQTLDELPSQTGPSLRQQRIIATIVAIVGLTIIVGGFFAIQALYNNPATAENLRDIFIIVLALEFMVIGLALVILLVQLARLINLLQNEVRPILQSTSQAANTLRGTANFLSQNLVGPVLKVNSTIAALRRAADMLNFGRKKN
jgi:hypothetical protein